MKINYKIYWYDYDRRNRRKVERLNLRLQRALNAGDLAKAGRIVNQIRAYGRVTAPEFE